MKTIYDVLLSVAEQAFNPSSVDGYRAVEKIKNEAYKEFSKICEILRHDPDKLSVIYSEITRNKVTHSIIGDERLIEVAKEFMMYLCSFQNANKFNKFCSSEEWIVWLFNKEPLLCLNEVFAIRAFVNMIMDETEDE